jgi:hypothetical protein
MATLAGCSGSSILGVAIQCDQWANKKLVSVFLSLSLSVWEETLMFPDSPPRKKIKKCFAIVNI